MADPQNVWMLPKEDRLELIQTIAMKIVDMFVDVSFNDHKDFTYVDKTNLYARNLLSLSLFYFEYSDAYEKVMVNVSLDAGVTCYQCLLAQEEKTTPLKHSIFSFNMILVFLLVKQPSSFGEGLLIQVAYQEEIFRMIFIWSTLIMSLRRLFRILEAVKQKQLLQDWEKYYECLIQCYKILIKILVFLPHLGSTRSPKKTRTSILF